MIWKMTTWEALTLNSSFGIIGSWAEGFVWTHATVMGFIMKAKLCRPSRRVCQLTYDLLKCNHPNVRVDCFLFPLALGEFALTFQKSTSLVGWGVGLWNVPTPSLWSCECVGSSFYCLYNVSSLALNTGYTMWLSSLLEATATLAGWPGEPWSTLWLSAQTVAHDEDIPHLEAHPNSPGPASVMIGFMTGPGRTRSTELQAAASPPGRVMALCSDGGMGPQKPIHAALYELSQHSCSAGIAAKMWWV